MSRRVVRTVLPLALAALLAASAALGFVAGGSRVADTPTIIVVFHSNGTFNVALPDGTPVGTTGGSPTVISPGTHNVNIDDSVFASDIEFDLAGPSVKLVSDASRGEAPSETWVETFLPNSTYTYRDDARPPTVWTFVTSATPTSSGGSGATTTSPVSTKPIASGTTGKASSTDPVGSGIAVFRGTLDGIVDPAGAVTLKLKGKAVSILKSGKYTFSITDNSKTAGFIVQQNKKAATTIATGVFVGKKTKTITMGVGQWVFYPSIVGKKSYFVVTR